MVTDPMATLEFTKMHGCGNDYVYVFALAARPADPASLARRVADRHFGIGGDGLIMIAPSARADVRMEMFNADGSRGDMCGNGIRCVARLAYERGVTPKRSLIIETDSGLKTVDLKFEGQRVCGATVDMGEPVLEARDIPAGTARMIVDYALEVGGRTERITAVSMGNPHCVVFVKDSAVFEMDIFEFARLGRQFENHAFFPRRVNTEFIWVRSRSDLKMRVWERGSGETLACGTGACAALVAAVLSGRSDRRAVVELSGGNLEIEWREKGASANHVFMTGNAVEVFRGQLELDADEMIPVPR